MVSEIKERKQVFMAFTSAFIVFVKGPQNEEQLQTIEMPFLSLDNVI